MSSGYGLPTLCVWAAFVVFAGVAAVSLQTYRTASDIARQILSTL